MNSIIAQHEKTPWENYTKVRAEVRGQLERGKKPSGFWSRLVLWWNFEREVRKEMKRRFPPGALYFR